jgi:hypothetical protein
LIATNLKVLYLHQQGANESWVVTRHHHGWIIGEVQYCL